MEHSEKILIVDDHDAVMAGLIPPLNKTFPQATILKAQSRQQAERTLSSHPDLMLAIVDLSLPIQSGEPAKAEVGFDLVSNLLDSTNAPNILVLSTNPKPLIRLKSKINNYEGGFAIADKVYSVNQIMDIARMAVRGAIYWSRALTNMGLAKELERLWLEVAKLKFQQGLNDRAIAEHLQVSDRTVRNYWLRMQDALGIPDDPQHDTRVKIMLRLKELGVLD